MEPAVPSRKQAQAERVKEMFDAQKSEQAKIVRAFERVAKTADGLFVLQKIFSDSQYGANALVLTREGDVSPNILMVKQGRAGLWLDLRKYLSRETLIKIEYPEPVTETKGK